MMAFDVQNGAKGMRLPHLRNGIFFEFSLCLSRACLGKMFVSMYKWLKNAVFSHLSRRVMDHVSHLLHVTELLGHGEVGFVRARHHLLFQHN